MPFELGMDGSRPRFCQRSESAVLGPVCSRIEMAAAASKTSRSVTVITPSGISSSSTSVSISHAKEAFWNRSLTRAREFPTYHRVYRSMLRIEMPRWAASYEMVDGIVDYVAYGGHDRAISRSTRSSTGSMTHSRTMNQRLRDASPSGPT